LSHFKTTIEGTSNHERVPSQLSLKHQILNVAMMLFLQFDGIAKTLTYNYNQHHTYSAIPAEILHNLQEHGELVSLREHPRFTTDFIRVGAGFDVDTLRLLEEKRAMNLSGYTSLPTQGTIRLVDIDSRVKISNYIRQNYEHSLANDFDSFEVFELPQRGHYSISILFKGFHPLLRYQELKAFVVPFNNKDLLVVNIGEPPLNHIFEVNIRKTSPARD
jgi:hypothetical protein